MDYKTIWNDPHNAALKQKRQSPNILYPGDMLYIPDKQDKQASRATSQTHTFTISRGLTRLRIVLDDADFKPIANARYILNFTTKSKAASADGAGLIDEEVDMRNSEVGTLTVGKTDSVFDVELGVRVGHLNPLDTPSGQMARLNNLGYFAGDLRTGDLMDQKQPYRTRNRRGFNRPWRSSSATTWGRRPWTANAAPKRRRS